MIHAPWPRAARRSSTHARKEVPNGEQHAELLKELCHQGTSLFDTLCQPLRFNQHSYQGLVRAETKVLENSSCASFLWSFARYLSTM